MEEHLKDLFLVSSLNFNTVQPLLNSLYSPHNYSHRDPKAMLCSLLLMVQHKVTSIPTWVQLTRSIPLLAILSGFDPTDTPGVGTYYDFKKRLIDGPSQKPGEHMTQRSSFRLGKTLRSLKKESAQKKEDLNPHPPHSEKLVDELLPHADQPRPHAFSKILEDFSSNLPSSPPTSRASSPTRTSSSPAMAPSSNPQPPRPLNPSVPADLWVSSAVTVPNLLPLLPPLPGATPP